MVEFVNKWPETYKKGMIDTLAALSTKTKDNFFYVYDGGYKGCFKIKDNFELAMNDDFNTPLATAEMLASLKVINKIIVSNNKNLIAQANALVNMFEKVLGLVFKSEEKVAKKTESTNDEKLLDLISSVREKLRANKNFELSDYIRDELNKLNININDKKI